MLIDNYGRVMNYVRLAVTDRCNLRCFYCMPEEGINYLPRKDLLSYEEMTRLMHILVDLGITKVRITGGEPFLRKDMMQFLTMLSELPLQEVHITTNGTLTEPLVPKLKSLGIKSVNLSLDTLDQERFLQITRRDELHKVLGTLESLLSHDIRTKINMVVMPGRNDQDIISMLELCRQHPLTVRFIEEMPFNGSELAVAGGWDHHQILQHIRNHYPSVSACTNPPNSTASHYKIEGFKGDFGIIAAYSRTFCGSCNRLRITPQGVLRTCLYAQGVFSLRDLLRQGLNDAEIMTAIGDAVAHRFKDGFEAEKHRSQQVISESMSSIGG